MDAYDDGGFTPPNLILVRSKHHGTADGVAHHRSRRRNGDDIRSANAIPLLGALLNILFGLGVILGLGGLVAKILNRKDRPGDQGGYYDDGARV